MSPYEEPAGGRERQGSGRAVPPAAPAGQGEASPVAWSPFEQRVREALGAPRHDVDCQASLAAAIQVECIHGALVCPTCDPCCCARQG